MKIRTGILGAVFLLIIVSLGYLSINPMNINEIGLKVLSFAKSLRGQSVSLAFLDEPAGPSISHENWTELLQKHVEPSGKVNYRGFIEDSILVSKYLHLLNNNPPGTNWTSEERMAYWINAYNAFTVKLIMDHYPLQSIKDINDGLPMINSPWDLKFFAIDDVPFDLNTIEHEILRKRFKEPLIHFAINCASISCPKLRTEAFTAELLEEQLEDQAYSFLNDKMKNLITKDQTQISEIFNWFQHDFTKEKSLKAFIKTYRPDLVMDHDIVFMTYDWGLNE